MTNEPSSSPPFAPDHVKVGARRKLRQYLGPTRGERAYGFLQFWELVFTGFINNRCPVRATALAYTTLLALIPMIAVAASISTSILKSQGDAPIKRAIDKLVEQITPNLEDAKLVDTNTTTAAVEPVQSASGVSTNAVTLTDEQRRKLGELAQTVDRNQIAAAIKSSLDRIESGSLGISGMLGLIVVAIMLFSTIEATFNDIWGVSRGRSWVARVVQYWATVTLGPLIPLLVYSVNIGASLDSVQAWMVQKHLGFISQLAIGTFQKLAPLLVLSFGFAFFYQLMPNTKVRWKAALVGGLTGGILWQLNSVLSVHFVSRAVTSAKIYGSLAMIPVFLFGLYLSWLILLFGAQVAYAFQNRVAYLQEKEALRINFLGREYLALRIMTLIGQRFDNARTTAPSVIDIGQALGVSTRLVDDILKSMRSAELVMETLGREIGYALTRPLEKISCHDVLHALRTARGEVVDTAEDGAKHAVDAVFEKVLLAERTVSGRTTLRQLVDEAGELKLAEPPKRTETVVPAWAI